MREPIRAKGICTICWENNTKDNKYNDVCDKCLPLTNKDRIGGGGSMKPERVEIINGNKVEEFYWGWEFVIYVNNRKFKGTFEEAVTMLKEATTC